MNSKMTPIELARQTLMQLAKSQTPPTPENFRRVYDEISGVASEDHSVILNKTLKKVLHEMGKGDSRYLAVVQEINALVEQHDATKLEGKLRVLLQPEVKQVDETNWARLLRYLLKQLETNHAGLTISQKKEGLNRVIINFSHEPNQLGQKIHALVASWGEEKSAIQTVTTEPYEVVTSVPHSSATQVIPHLGNQASGVDENPLSLAMAWRDMLVRTISLIVLPQFAGVPIAVKRIEAMIQQAQASQTIAEVNQLSEALKSTLLRAEMQHDSQHRMQEALVQMLRLLVSSMGELTIEDKWLHGQLAIVQEIIDQPLNIDSVYNAESSLKELIMKQSSIKPGLIEAKDTIKNMMSTFVSGLAEITESAGTYQANINRYQDQITATDDMKQLNAILQNLVGDIGVMNAAAQKSHDSFQETQKKVDEAEKQISELTMKLEYISEVAHQDFLTGALNRRGMDEAIHIEFERADRHHTPLSLAMIDIDHFKKINDTMGHSTGDVALAHLAKVVKSVLRSTDVLARYGGEEFVVILPGSKQDDAVKVITGVQRELTKKFFLHNNERVLMTFSAGVSERMTGEGVDAVLPRADAALYAAKQSGRNRVIGAITPEPITQQFEETANHHVS
jgi:diguanylate cyclase